MKRANGEKTRLEICVFCVGNVEFHLGVALMGFIQC